MSLEPRDEASDETSDESYPPKTSVWKALISIIDKPTATFRALNINPRFKWLLPLILAILMAVLTAVLSAPHSSELANQTSQTQINELNLSAEETAAMLEQTAMFRSPVFFMALGSVTAIVLTPILWGLISTVLYFVAVIAGAELKFVSTFLIVAWASLPITLRSLIQAIIIGVTGRFPLYPGLAALQITGDPLKDSTNPLVALLSFADIFWIWHVILLTLGLSVVAKFSKTKSLFVVLFYVAIAIGLAVGLVLLSASFAVN